MDGKETKHLKAFRDSKLKPNEIVVGSLEGWIGEMMGSGDKTQRNGQFVLTNERACFYRKGLLGEVFETIPLAKISSVETLSRLGYRVIRLHTSNTELAFKTFESKPLFSQVYDQLEALRHLDPATAQGTPQNERRQERECPYCAERILAKAKICKHCGRDVAEFAESTAGNKPPEAEPRINVLCPCGTKLRIRANLAGKKVKCPKCDAVMRVPIVS